MVGVRPLSHPHVLTPRAVLTSPRSLLHAFHTAQFTPARPQPCRVLASQTHLLPPNLLKLFAPRPPLPYLKPTGRDPDLPLKSLSARRAPKPIVVSETLRQIREEQDQKERDAVEKGERPDRGEAEDQGVGADTKQKAEQAEVKVEEATGGEVPAKPDGDAAVKPEGTSAMAEDKEEGEEPDRAAAAAIAASAKGGKKDLKASQPTDAVTVDLCEEEKFQLRKRERQRKREEAMSKPCGSKVSPDVRIAADTPCVCSFRSRASRRRRDLR